VDYHDATCRRAAARIPTISRRRLVALAAFAALGLPNVLRAAEPATSPVPIIRSFYEVLLSAMKDGPKIGFAGRRDRLAPAIRQTFDLPAMTRLMVGPQWTTIAPDIQKQLIDAFSAFSIATYANRFDDFSGEQFEVQDEPVAIANGDTIVKSSLILDKGGDPPDKSDQVELDYLMRREGGRWHVIDVYLSGTVSELATRRSEFSSVLRRDGAGALVELLQKRTAALAS
jgi:phospholipid transport system substrate-binding protein